MKKLILIMAILLLPLAAQAADGTRVAYNAGGAAYEGYYISPGPKAPLVLLIHDWDGLGAYEIKRAQILSDLGYAVFAADLFGQGVKADSVDARRKLTGALYQNRAKMRAIMYAALEAAKGQGANLGNAVAIGYCFGGAAVLELARSGADLKGFVTFHGGLATPQGQDYSKTKGSLLVLHGSADTSVTLDQFADLAKQLEAAGISHEMITYSGAPHAFTVFGGDRYQEAADKKSWARFVGYLQETLRQ